MIEKGQVFEVSEDDGYHHYPKGHFVALRDIEPAEVMALHVEHGDDGDLVEALIATGAIKEATMPCIDIRYPSYPRATEDEVHQVGTWCR